jgi:hypothetical protein
MMQNSLARYLLISCSGLRVMLLFAGQKELILLLQQRLPLISFAGSMLPLQ